MLDGADVQPFETREYLSELLMLADRHFFMLFGITNLLTRAIPTAENRLSAVRSTGYKPFEWEQGLEHYWVHSKE